MTLNPTAYYEDWSSYRTNTSFRLKLDSSYGRIKVININIIVVIVVVKVKQRVIKVEIVVRVKGNLKVVVFVMV
jgi:hypothetical protein